MKEIPILYSTPMVQAKLARRKTVTRRLIKPQPIDNRIVDGNFYEGNHKGYVKIDGHPDWQKQFSSQFAKWQPGDVLYCRECFINDADNNEPPVWVYKADNANYPMVSGQHWNPSIHMPKSAARIWDRVISVRPERLRDITEEDAVREGIEPVPSFDSGEGVYPGQKYKNYLPDGYREVTAIDSFKSLWISINGSDSWEENLWVWRIETETLSTTGRPGNL